MMLVYFVILLVEASCVTTETDCGNKCGGNETWVSCKTICPPQFCNISYTDFRCDPDVQCTCVPGCDCIKDYLRDDRGLCVLNDDCPPPPQCGVNEVPTSCKNESQLCDASSKEGSSEPCERGCNCIEGFLRDANGDCIPEENCPKTCNGDRNATYKECPNPCQQRCDAPRNNLYCKRKCDPFGCECFHGYLLNLCDGKCYLPEDCPGGDPCGKNETYVPCNVKCPRNYCPDSDSRLIPECDPPKDCPAGCACKQNYSIDSSGSCILSSDCPEVPCTRQNEEWNSCPGPCFPDSCKDINKTNEDCDVSYDHYCQPQCVCKKGFRRNDDDICVPICDCPKPPIVCKENEEPSECKQVCPPQTCEFDNTKQACKPGPCQRGCNCIKGYLRNKNEICIPKDQCTPTEPCSVNQTFVSCRVPCPKDYCPDSDSRDMTMICDPIYPCPSGCICKKNYLIKDLNSKDCILASECPPVQCTRQNEVWNPCTPPCFSERCNDVNETNTDCGSYGPDCKPQCVCVEGTKRNDSDICVPIKECPPPPLVCGVNEVPSDCKQVCPPQTCAFDPKKFACKPGPCQPGCNCIEGYLRNGSGICIPKNQCPPKCNDRCTPTCLIPNPPDCPKHSPPINNPCKCSPGYILSHRGGECVKYLECQQYNSCNGDQNATFRQCPNPCQSTCEDPRKPQHCKRKCEHYGCECKYGYILKDGKCILPEDCSGGDPCGCNQTFSGCAFDCPSDNCPTNDSRGIKGCSPPFVCHSGCSCKANYSRRSYDDLQCILTSDCPPVNCTRQNEVWNSCPHPCFSEECTDVGQPIPPCDIFDPNCHPQCVCMDGYKRNESGICVPIKECKCNDRCTPTCLIPNPPDCPKHSPPINNPCKCSPGYILSHRGGECVKYLECQQYNSCNGDQNATFRQCPNPCQSTCEDPRKPQHCKRKCEHYGCECKYGYILKDGKCILPEDCSGGDPCGCNQTFSGCAFDCPSDNCPTNDSRGIKRCSPPFVCHSGCSCKANYSRRSYEDPQCILTSDCPQVECTRKNEEWDPCPPPCFSDSCEDINKAKEECETGYGPYCRPRCVCKKGFKRNSSGICVPIKKCQNRNCHGDRNATYQECPNPCPSTCEAPERPKVCKKKCKDFGCQCNSSYILNGDKCVLPEDCPGGNPCGKNKTFVGCSFNCPTLSCPRSDTRAIVACSLPYPCYPGCACKINYLKNGTECILASDCPPVNCTRQNEVWNSCPHPCFSEECTDVGQPIPPCDIFDPNCHPRCVCIDGHKRNESGICVPIKECTGVCGINEEPSDCKQECPPQYCDYDPETTACKPGPCRPGCNCIDGYLRNSSDVCIPKNQCPAAPVKCTGQNEEWNPCPIPCFTEQCTDVGLIIPTCRPPVTNTDCHPRCVCMDGYKRNASDICVPISECPGVCGINEQPSECKQECPPQSCDYNSEIPCTAAPRRPGCDCIEGYLRNSSDICVPINQQNCFCDQNATYKECPDACPLTCEAPERFFCNKACKAFGCQCNNGYILNGDKCVLPQDCLGGDPCGENKTFTECLFNCPTNLCPLSDSRDIFMCTSPCPCVPGCKCKMNYLENGRSCVLASDCPPVNCTRQYEEWNSCPSPCFSEQCTDIGQPQPTCGISDPNYCNPRCVCMYGYKRNDSDVCVPIRECPGVCGINEQPSACKQQCPPQSCDYNSEIQCTAGPCQPGCDCIEGHLRNSSGICVPIDQCPVENCFCDQNATYKECPDACPLTCEAPERFFCNKACKAFGCQCNNGYILNGDKCVLPQDCLGGDPCGENKTFTECYFSYPSNLCPLSDSRDMFMCTSPYPCVPGCKCKMNYLENGRSCVLASDCPPVNCTRQYEEWNSCPSPCFSEQCTDIGQPQPTCGISDPNYCNPRCVCMYGYKKNDSDVCVPIRECPGICGTNEEPTDCMQRCPPQTCSYNPKVMACTQGPCQSGCNCINDYVRNSTGICIPKDQCPVGCDED